MTTVTVATGIDRAARLIPFYADNLRGDYAAVCSPVRAMPEPLREAQRIRTNTYMRTGSRTEPGFAPRYYVTSYDKLIAWVSLDGKTHYAPVLPSEAMNTGRPLTPRERAMLRHRDAIQARWPAFFRMTDQGDPIYDQEY